MDALMSFSQDSEDIILYHMLKNVDSKIHWIDVGANDPVKISVTKFFSSGGGYGINIEPQAQLLDRLKKDRPKDINLGAGISNKEGRLKLHGQGVFASFDENNGWVGKEEAYEVPVTTLAKVCEKKYIKGDIHFMKIDVEGWEKEVLEGMDFGICRPWILCIESYEPYTHQPKWESWEHLLTANGYSYYGSSEINRYYAADERKDVLCEFADSQEIRKKYKIIQYDEAKKAIFVYRKWERKRKRQEYIKWKILNSKPLYPAKLIYRLLKK